MWVQPRSEITGIAEEVHGDVGEALGKPILDFSTNLNPFGPSPRVVEAMQNVQVHHYPDRECLHLRQQISSQLRIPVESIIVGNGSSELLWLATFAYLQPGTKALILGPTYGEYARCARLMQGVPLFHTATSEHQFGVNAQAIAGRLQELEPRMVFLANPNNPTGQSISTSVISAWITDHPQTLFIVDEAYVDFSPETSSMIGSQAPNLLVLRSMTKAHGIAGLRLGYAVGHPEMVNALCRVRPPWTVNSLAQVAGVAALQDAKHLKESLEKLRPIKEALIADLTNLGLRPVPSVTHFFLVPVKDGAVIRERLTADRILVRDCSSFGLPDYVRISTRLPLENQQLVSSLRRRLQS